jgi:WD40 repeat protein
MANVLKLISALVILFGFASISVEAHSEAISDCRKWSESQSPLKVEGNAPAKEDARVISTFRWIPDTQCIVVGQIDGLSLYNIHDVENPVKLVETQNVRDIAVSSDGEQIAFTLDDHPTAYVLTAPDVVSPIETPKQAITAITFSPDGKTLATAGADIEQDDEIWFYVDRQVYIRDLEYGEAALVLPTVEGHRFGFVREIFFAPNSSNLLMHVLYPHLDVSNNMEYWDISSQTLLWDWNSTLIESNWDTEFDPILAELIEMQDSRLVIGGVYDFRDFDEYAGYGLFIYNNLEKKPTRITEMITSQFRTPDYSNVTAIGLNHSATLIASINSNGLMQFWDVSSGERLSQFETSYTTVGDLSFSDSDKFLAMRVFAEDRQDIVVWDVETQEEVAVIEGHLDEK